MNNIKKEDRSLIVIMHLSALLTGFIGPLILWTTQRDKIIGMEEHGKAAVNFQITSLLFFFIVFFGAFFCCVGFILVPFWILFTYIFPIVSAVNASGGKPPYYPLNIKFIA